MYAKERKPSRTHKLMSRIILGSFVTKTPFFFFFGGFLKSLHRNLLKFFNRITLGVWSEKFNHHSSIFLRVFSSTFLGTK